MIDHTSEDEIKYTIMDSIWKCIDGSIKPEQIVSSFAEQKEKHKQFESLLADVISIIDIEIGSFGTSSSNILNSDDSNNNLAVKKDKFFSLVTQLRPIVGDELLKERLELETLETLKLIGKKEVFNQKYIKIKTRLFYKQQKFNLLREEAEGYSKLITILDQNNLNNKILENIQSLIGCFNLDPNRVLDIILESFENYPHLHKTFIGLLKHYKAEDDTICQIIGFKFQALHQLDQQQHSSKSDSITESNYASQASSLYTITSYLLKDKIIDLDLLMTHLYPTDQQISQFYKEELESARQYAKKLTVINLAESSNSGPNPPSLNQIDISSSSTSSSAPLISISEDKFSLIQQLQQTQQSNNNKYENQKVSLIKSLIEIGDYKTALKIIERLPQWYIATYCDIAINICKALDANYIDSMYRKFNSLSKYLKDKLANSTKPKSSSNIKIDEDESMITESDDTFSYFNENIIPVLSALGPGISFEPVLFTKLIRICVAFLDSKKFSSNNNNNCSASETQHSNGKEFTPPPQPQNDLNGDESTSSSQTLNPAAILNTLTKSELNFYNQIYAILNEILLPSLSMTTMNPCLAIELWSLLKLFPYEMRYNLYNNWRQYTYKYFPLLIRAKADCQEKIKYLLKRLTKENIKIYGRQIGKLSHNNPIIVCDYILTQIQRYDNFIIPVVDSLKFMTPLSYDVLSYCIIIAISDADKDKMKHDSTNISSWLQSIATFCALTFKKYPIELIAMIQYVINQLKNRKSYDLLILQEIVQKMCGIEVLSEVNDLQLEAMAGGDLLRQEAGYFNPIRNIKKCANRLKEALADHGLILPLCILLSQQRDFIVYADQAERERQMSKNEKQHLKLTGCLYDQCQDSLVQFSQFLSSTLTTEEYIHIFPKIDELVNEYHVSADVAFFLSRPMYAHHIQSKYDELRRMDRNIKTVEKPSKTQRYLEAIDVVMQPVIDLARTLHQPKIWEDMSPLFYTTFWTLSMSDCLVPTNAYEKQRISLKQKLNALDDNQEYTSTKKKKEKEKIMIMLDKLAEEENKQKDHVQHVKARFEKEKDHWFPQKSKTKNETITVFLQLCIFSRCLFTQIDAYYCSKFIQIIHSLKTPNFSTIICYDRIFSDISYSIASLTDNEARRYGRFLLGLLETVMSWHSDQNTFENECSQYPGFLTVFRNALNTAHSSASSNKQEQLDYENFRHVCHKWHYKLTKSFIVCLESEEYLQMRNSLIILTKILPHYPKLTGFCSALEKRVEKIKQTEKEKRQDIFTLASAYLGLLKQKKSQMVDEAKFHLKDQQPGAATTPSTNRAQNGTSTAAQQKSDPKFRQPDIPSKSNSTISNGQNKIQTSSSKSTSSTSGATLTSNTISNPSINSSNASATNGSNSNSSQQTSSSSTQSGVILAEIKAEQIIQTEVTKQSSSSSSSSNSESQSNYASIKSPVNSSSSQQSSSQPSSSAPTSTRIVISSSSTSNTSNTSSHAKSPPSFQSNGIKSESKTQSSDKKDQSSSVGSLSKSSSSSKRSASSSSPSQQSSGYDLPSTPTRNGNNTNPGEGSPTSSVSSDDWPSPKRIHSSQEGYHNNGSSSGHHHHSSHHGHSHHSSNKTHSRSSSPSNTKSSNNGGYYSSNGNSSYSTSSSSNRVSSSSDKSKRIKTSDDSKSYSSSAPSTNISNTDYITSSSSSSSSATATSSKRKSSRERGERSDKDKDRSEKDKDRNEKDKEKKEHRKREHSSEVASDVQHKRSKSDETKRKSSTSSSATGSSNGSSTVNSGSNGNSNSVNNSSNSSSLQSTSSSGSSSSSSRKSSKKHESSSSIGIKDEYQSASNGLSNSLSSGQTSISSSTSNSSISSSNNKISHRSTGDERRSSNYDKKYYPN